MTPLGIDLTSALAAQRARDLHRAAAESALAALARCCQPSTWGRFAPRTAPTVARLRSPLRPDPQDPAVACCVMT